MELVELQLDQVEDRLEAALLLDLVRLLYSEDAELGVWLVDALTGLVRFDHLSQSR